MESFLETRILDEIPHTLVKQLAKFVRAKQMEKSPFSRSDAFVNEMMEKYAEWLAEQDVPEPIVRANALMIPHARVSGGSSLLKKGRSMEKISPSMFGRMKSSITVASPSTEPTASQPIMTPQHTLRRLPLGDDVFVMDEMDMTHAPSANVGSLPPVPSSATAMPISVSVPAWKASGSTRSVLFFILTTPWHGFSMLNLFLRISVWT
jgi:inhibitor of Bruton tyrosine kinase